MPDARARARVAEVPIWAPRRRPESTTLGVQMAIDGDVQMAASGQIRLSADSSAQADADVHDSAAISPYNGASLSKPDFAVCNRECELRERCRDSVEGLPWWTAGKHGFDVGTTEPLGHQSGLSIGML